MDGTWLLEGERDMVDKVDISRPWTILPRSLSLHPAPDVGGGEGFFYCINKNTLPFSSLPIVIVPLKRFRPSLCWMDQKNNIYV